MTEQTIDNLDDAGVTENIGAFTADTGDFSEENMEALDANERIDHVFIATGRPPNDLSAKQKMARRKAIIEPVFGQIKHCQGFRQFLLRGLENMKGEWELTCLTHNLLKLFWSGAIATG